MSDNSTVQYRDSSAKRFDITEHCDFDEKGRALCPVCSPNYENNNKTLALVPDSGGAYKCFRGCTPEEIREELGCPKPKMEPKNLTSYKRKEKKLKLYNIQRIKEANQKLLSLQGEALEAVRYLANRLIDTDMIVHYRLGLERVRIGEDMAWGIGIPIESASSGAFFLKKRRCPWNEELSKHPKYAPWSNFGIPPTIFFSYKPKEYRETWVFEGEWDAIVIGWAAAKNKIDVCVCSFTCGCESIPPRNELNRLEGEIRIFYDRNDKINRRGKRPGEEGAKKLAKAIGRRAKIALVPMHENETRKGWDATDAIKAGFTLENFEAASMSAFYPPEEIENPFLAQCRTMKEVYDTAPDYIEWLVPDLLSQNELFCLASEPRAGKSLFALGLAKSIASGTPFLGRPVAKGTVVYVAKEDPDDKIKQRVIAQGWGLEEMENVLVNNRFTLEDLPDLIEYAKRFKPNLIVLDTLSRIQKSNHRENSSEMSDILGPLQDLCQEEEVCILVVHHTRKKASGDEDTLAVFDSVRGSSALRGTCRGMMVLNSHKDGYRLAVETGRTDLQDLRVYLDKNELNWKLIGEWNQPIINITQKDTILKLLVEKGSLSIDQIHIESNIHKKNIYSLLTRLNCDQHVLKVGHRRNAVYSATNLGVEFVEKLLNSRTAHSTSGTASNSTIQQDFVFFDDQASSRSVAVIASPDRDRISGETFSVESVEKVPQKYIEEESQQFNSNSTNSHLLNCNRSTRSRSTDHSVPPSDHIICSTNEEKDSLEQKSVNWRTSQRKERLKGIFHEKLGFMYVVSKRRTKVRARKPGERIEIEVKLSGCDSRRVYETYCTL